MQKSVHMPRYSCSQIHGMQTRSIGKTCCANSWRDSKRGTTGSCARIPQSAVTSCLPCFPTHNQEVSTLEAIAFVSARRVSLCPLMSAPVIRSGTTAPLVQKVEVMILLKLLLSLQILYLPIPSILLYFLLVLFFLPPFFSCEFFHFFHISVCA